MSEPAENSTEAVNKPKTELITSTDEDPFAESATPLQGRKKGFPVMPSRHNMLGMPSQPRPDAREKMRPRNGPPISEWEAVLIGKRLVPEDAEDNENVGLPVPRTGTSLRSRCRLLD
jgi:hypothetical protein